MAYICRLKCRQHFFFFTGEANIVFAVAVKCLGAHTEIYGVSEAKVHFQMVVEEALGLLSKIRKVVVRGLIGHAIVVVVLLLEMLVGTELAEQSEQHMQRFDHRLIILELVHGDVAHSANDLRVISNVHVDLWAGECSLLKCLFHLRRPLLH